MGAASSIIKDQFPEEIKALVDVIEGQKNRIAEYDSQLLEKEVTKMFKGHNQIIDILTARTKLQVKRLLDTYPSCVTLLDQLIEGGNAYAKFIKQLAIPKEQIELTMATSNSDYDEEALIDVIGTSSINELKKFDADLIKAKSYSLHDLFSSQCKQDSLLFKFTSRILKLDRDESKSVDKGLAAKQAEVIHRSGAARLLGVDEDPIIEILACASRTQCAAIAQSYQELFNMKLERAINMKFKGNCGKLMVMWSQPVANAIVSCLGFYTQKMLVDLPLIGQFLAKYDKDVLAAADQACQATHQKPLSEFIKHGILTSSTLHRACKGWIESASPDKGFEKITQLYLESKLPSAEMTAEDLKALSQNEDIRQKFKILLEKQAQEIKLYMIDRKIKLDPNDQAVLSRSSTQSLSPLQSGSRPVSESRNGSIATFSQNNLKSLNKPPSNNDLAEQAIGGAENDDDEGDTLQPLSPIGRKSTFRNENNGRSTIFATNYKSKAIKNSKEEAELKEKNSQRVYNYLLEKCEAADEDSEGSFDGPDFWRLLRTLPLDDFGMTDDDIDTIRQFCTWENEDDGRVYYFEVLFELAESVMTAIESKSEGETDVGKVMDALAGSAPSAKLSDPASPNIKNPTPIGGVGGSANKSPAASLASPTLSPRDETFILSSKAKRQTVMQYPNVPLYFRQYLIDTITAFDYDLNGYLTSNEIDGLISALNIPTLTPEQFFPGNAQKVIPKDASDIICKNIHTWFKDGTDHYICLVDKASGAYFWYNTRDESTQWADTGYSGTEDATNLGSEEQGATPLAKQESIKNSVKQESVKQESAKAESSKPQATKSSSELNLNSANDEVKSEVSPSSKLVVSQSAPSLVSEKVTQQE